MVQNNAARVIYNMKKSDHISSTLKDLHWLPVRSRILYKVLLTVYKTQHGFAPKYLVDLLNPYIPVRSLRSSSLHLLDIPQTNLTKYGDRAFAVCAAKEWNKLPVTIREVTTVETFKVGLKTHLFRLAYETLM